MASTLEVNVEIGIEESTSDNLSDTQLMIDVGPVENKNLQPGSQTTVKLTAYNYSSQGRMAIIRATFDGNKISVEIPITDIYIAPQGSTVVYTVIRSFAYIGLADVRFYLALQ